MAERVILVCDKCKSEKDVHEVQLLREGKRSRAELCGKCFVSLSDSFSFGQPRRGWSKKEIIPFDEIPRNTP